MRSRTSAPLTCSWGSTTKRSPNTRRRSNVEPANATVRLNLRLAYYKSGPTERGDTAAQDRAGVRARPVERVSDPRRLLPADRPVPARSWRCSNPREAMFGDDLRVRVRAGDGAASTPARTRRGQRYVDRIFRAGESAEAHLLMGIAHLNHLDYPAGEDRAGTGAAAESGAADRELRYGAIPARARRPARGASGRSETSSKININDFEANLRSAACASTRRSSRTAQSYLGRAIAIRPKDLTARKVLASRATADGRRRGGGASILEEIVKEAPDWWTRTSNWRRPTTV